MNTSLIFRKSEFRFFILLALSGLILRGLYLFEYAHFVNFDLAIGADVGEYHSRASELLKGIFFPAAPEIHAPLYSFFLAGLQKAGFGIPGIRVFQTLLNYLSWMGLYFLLRKKNVPEKQRLVFLGLAMCLAPLIFHPAELISEALLLPLLTGVFFFFDLSEKNDRRSVAVFSSLAGLFSALALLCHGMMTGYLLLQSAFLFVRKKWLSGTLFLSGALLVIVPFIIAKSCHYGKLTGLQANTAFNIFLGNNPKATGTCYIRPGDLWRKIHFKAQQDARKREISVNKHFREKIFAFWKKTPMKGLKLYWQKTLLIFSGKEYIAGADGGFLFCRTDTVNLLRFLTFPVFLLAFYGIWCTFKHKEQWWTPPLLLAFSLFIMQLLTVTSGRYRLLMFPGVIFLAAAGAVHFNWKKWYIPAFAVFFLSVWKTYSLVGANKFEGTALLGQAHFIKGNYVHARELLTYAGKRFKDASRIDNMLGNIAEKEGNLPLARQHYSKVTQVEPFMPEGWMNLANVTPDPVAADTFFRRALSAAAPSPSADLTFNYARFLHAVKRSSEAENFLAQTFKTDPDHVAALNLNGLIAAAKKDFKSASELFFRAARLSPREPGYWKNTAITARLAGNKALEQRAAQQYFTLTRKK